MVWLLPGAESARVSIIIIVTYLVGISGFSHIVAGSTTMFFLLVTKAISWSAFIVQFFIPTLLGNVIGGLSLVSALGTPRLSEGKNSSERDPRAPLPLRCGQKTPTPEYRSDYS